MKKILLIFMSLALVCFSGCKDNSKLSQMRKELDGNLVGVAFLGACEGGFSEVTEYVTEKFPEAEFLSEIDEEHFLQNEGYELYLVIPAKGTQLKIETLNFNDSYELVADETLGTFKDGKPLILKGNMAEFVPNLNIVAEGKGKKAEFSPVLSGMDGKLVEPGENVKALFLF